MKRISALFMILSLLFMVSCNSWRDTTATIVASGLTPVIAGAFTCTGIDAINSDVKERILDIPWLNKSMAKKAYSDKGVANVLCVTLANTVLPVLINVGTGELPVEWKCSGSLISGGLSELAVEACSKISI
jgi:hypothetical protein